MLVVFCLMKQNCYFQRGVVEFRHAATPLSSYSINTTHQGFQKRYITLLYLKGLKSYQPSNFFIFRNCSCEYRAKTFDIFLRHDSLMIFDGASPSSYMVGEYCGSSIPPTFTSTSNVVLIYFKSDGSRNGPGFKLEYKANSELFKIYND